jgi:ectoine hydroxylase-related dioxygenase (phytanoyl-CoA dioxygenase family)
MDGAPWLSRLDSAGAVLVRRAIANDALRDLERIADDRNQPPRRRGGIRNVLRGVPEALALAASPAVRGLAERVLGPACFAVRGILFDKTPAANWKVVWHQDLTIAVASRQEAVGFGPWTIKEGVLHVQAPTELLERMVALRIHLDDCTSENGPLRVIPGSHLSGRLTAQGIEAWRKRVPDQECMAAAGDVILMRPLLLHASATAIRPRRRRVLHLEFAAEDLQSNLEWAEKYESSTCCLAAARA